jgi:uncharacterized protein YndB with AHSA1/START domain
MDIDITTLARLQRAHGYVRADFSRLFDHSQRAVWAMLTEPDRLAQWLAPGEIEPYRGGQARLDFADSGVVIDSEVTAYVAPRLLEYSWSSPGQPKRPMRFTLTPEGDGCRLQLSLFVPEYEDVARAFAGFEAHLDMLATALEDTPTRFPFERFKAARDAYGRMLFV